MLKLTTIVVCLLMLSACAQVKPWQRGNLAQDIMQSSIDPLADSLDGHIYSSKEASSGGGQAAGGGCGCN